MFQKRFNKPFLAINRIRRLYPSAKLYAAWCAGCCTEVEMVTFAEAADIACTNIDAVIEQAAGGKVHLGVRPEAMLVCLHSLLYVNRLKLC